MYDYNDRYDKAAKEWDIIKTVTDSIINSKDCDECLKAKKEETKQREVEGELIHEVIKKLELLKVQAGDIVMIRVDGKKPGVPEMLNAFRRVFEQAKKKNVWIIAIPSDMLLEQVTKKDMNPAGWYRKDQLLDAEIWDDGKKDNKRKRRIIVDGDE